MELQTEFSEKEVAQMRKLFAEYPNKFDSRAYMEILDEFGQLKVYAHFRQVYQAWDAIGVKEEKVEQGFRAQIKLAVHLLPKHGQGAVTACWMKNELQVGGYWNGILSAEADARRGSPEYNFITDILRLSRNRATRKQSIDEKQVQVYDNVESYAVLFYNMKKALLRGKELFGQCFLDDAHNTLVLLHQQDPFDGNLPYKRKRPETPSTSTNDTISQGTRTPVQATKDITPRVKPVDSLQAARVPTKAIIAPAQAASEPAQLDDELVKAYRATQESAIQQGLKQFEVVMRALLKKIDPLVDKQATLFECLKGASVFEEAPAKTIFEIGGCGFIAMSAFAMGFSASIYNKNADSCMTAYDIACKHAGVQFKKFRKAQAIPAGGLTVLKEGLLPYDPEVLVMHGTDQTYMDQIFQTNWRWLCISQAIAIARPNENWRHIATFSQCGYHLFLNETRPTGLQLDDHLKAALVASADKCKWFTDGLRKRKPLDAEMKRQVGMLCEKGCYFFETPPIQMSQRCQDYVGRFCDDENFTLITTADGETFLKRTQQSCWVAFAFALGLIPFSKKAMRTVLLLTSGEVFSDDADKGALTQASPGDPLQEFEAALRQGALKKE